MIRTRICVQAERMKEHDLCQVARKLPLVVHAARLALPRTALLAIPAAHHQEQLPRQPPIPQEKTTGYTYCHALNISNTCPSGELLLQRIHWATLFGWLTNAPHACSTSSSRPRFPTFCLNSGVQITLILSVTADIIQEQTDGFLYTAQSCLSAYAHVTCGGYSVQQSGKPTTRKYLFSSNCRTNTWVCRERCFLV